ncbi:MAG: sterol desaturase family protein, partial [Bryobacteraceae bacterium]
MPRGIESVLSWIVVTPRLHGVHHSMRREELQSNYSTIFSIWDRIHRSFHGIDHHDHVTVGVPGYRDESQQTLAAALVMPFRKQRRYWQP